MHGHVNVKFLVFVAYRFIVYTQFYLAFRSRYMFDCITLNKNTKNLKATKLRVAEICGCSYV